MTALVDAALGYAARGWPVFPCKPRGKQPLTEHGFHDASTDAAQIEQWWTRWAQANIGIATGIGCDVLDVDLADYCEGVLDLPDCETDGGPVALTGAGKWHLYFAPTGIGRKIRFSQHCDWLGQGGYVIASPSVHPCGERYRWFGDTERLDLTDAPPLLLDAVKGRCGRDHLENRAPGSPESDERDRGDTRGADDRRRAGWSSRGLLDKMSAAVEGERNSVLHWCAARIGGDVNAGRIDAATARAVLDQLRDVAQQRGLEEREIDRTIASGLKGT